MKRIFFFIALVLLSSFVVAQGQKGVHDQGTGIESPEIKEAGQGTGQGKQTQITEQETQNEGEETNLKRQIKQKIRAKNASEVKIRIQERQQEMNQEIKGLSEKSQKVFRNQNQVRLAVHSLLAMEDLVGGIGKQVSEIAREFNNSVKSTIRAEERVQTRSKFARFFAGGDEGAAEEIEKEVNQNRQRVQELKRLREECDCSEEIKVMMREQIQNMEQEQNRLQELAQKERKSKGLIGWIWKWK